MLLTFFKLQMVQQVLIFHFFHGPNTFHIFFLRTCLIGLILVMETCRAIAVTELGGEEAWPLLRRAMFMEMQKNREQYLHVYLSAETLDNAMFRIGSHSKGPAPFIYWLEAPMGLYSTATFPNIAIAYYGSTDGIPHYNFLVLPLRRTT